MSDKSTTPEQTAAAIEPKGGNSRYTAPKSDNQMALPGLEVYAEVEKTRPWPDLSMYGLHFGIVALPNGEQRLVVVDEESAWSSIIKEWGFQRSRWTGMWVKDNLTFVLNQQHRKSLFPEMKVLRLTDIEIRNNIKSLIVSRQAIRASQVNDNPAAGRLSWHPKKRFSATPPEQSIPAVSPEVALRQTLYLGFNHLGQEIFESGDGKRFARANDAVVAREEHNTSSPVFLRQSASDAAGSLQLCAAGMVKEIEKGKNLRSEDFERYLRAIFGDTDAQEPGFIDAFNKALDDAMLAAVLEVAAATAGMQSREHDLFTTALKLHEGRPSYFRGAGNLTTPLPLAVAMQAILTKKMPNEASVILDINGTGTREHSWLYPESQAVSADTLIDHDVAIAGVFSSKIPETSVSGLKVSRADHKSILESLERRNPAGTSVFLVAGSTQVGKLDTDFKRVLSYIGANYELSGCVDIDSHMISSANEVPSRLLVVGPKREAVDHTFAVPTVIPVCYDYESLWSWAEQVGNLEAGKDATFGFDDTREDNRWQAPYIPSSQVSEPQAMSPRNLLGPVRKALARVVEETGQSVDDYVSSKLQWSMEELETYLDAEQTDAVALGIYNIDKGQGFVEADETGMGKGRVMASLMRYGRVKGLDVLFMSKEAQLFRDIYRDIADIGSMDLFANPFIINNDITLRDIDGVKIGRSPKKDELNAVLRSGEAPKNGFTLATYSQFNRKPSTVSSLEKTATAFECIEMLEKGISRVEVLNHWEAFLLSSQRDTHLQLRLDDPMLQPAGNNNDAAVQILRNYLSALSPAHLAISKNADLARQLEMREVSTDTLKAIFEKQCINDSLTLKQEWIRAGKAYANGLVFLDESHLAAGPTSQTNENLGFLVDSCKALAYASSTFAKDTANYSIYHRIFPASVNAATIADTLDRGGAPLQEILSAMLAEDGRMIRREHDLSMIDFRISVDTDRLERNEMWANRLAEVIAAMSLLSGEIEDMVEGLNAESEKAFKEAVKQAKDAGVDTKPLKTGVQYTNFSSRFYTLNRAFMLALNTDMSAAQAIKALQEGRKPVITVENTGEAALRDLLDPDSITDAVTITVDAEGNEVPPAMFDPLAGLGFMAGDDTSLASSGIGMGLDAAAEKDAGAADATKPGKKPKAPKIYPKNLLGRRVGFKDILQAYAENIFYGWKWDEKKNPDGSVTKVRVRADFKQPGMEAGFVEIRRMIDDMPEIPISPLDVLKDTLAAAGYSIDELSGRTLQLTEEPDGTHAVSKMADRSKSYVIDGFNNGLLDAALLSTAGSTGISLHASQTFADQSKRELVELQPPSDIVKRIQFWGRVNRKGQVCHPIINMISSGLPGEKRLMTMQNAKLRKMSANISGNADNSALDEDAPDILNRIGNEVCYRWLEANPVVAKIMGIRLGEMLEAGTLKADGSVSFSGTRFVDLVTGRILMLDVPSQRRVYAEITKEFHALVEQYELEGRNPLKSGELDIRAKRGDSVVIEIPTSAEISVFNASVMATELNYTQRLEGIPIETLKSECKAGREAVFDQFQSHSWNDLLSQKIDDDAARILPSLLSKRHATIEEAMADKENNAVKNFVARITYLKNKLKYFMPGSTFALQYSQEAPVQRFLVVGLNIPDDKVTVPSEYTLKVRSAWNRNLITMNLSTLMKAGMACQPEIVYGEQAYAKSIKWVFQKLAETKDYEMSRVILEGNLFRAAQIAEKRKMGQAITYSDEKGVWHHAIVLPQNVTLDNINDLPVELTNAAMMEAFLKDENHQTLLMSHTFQMDDREWAIAKDKGNLYVISEQPNELAGWLTDNAALQATLSSPFEGDRGHRVATVNQEQLGAFCVAMMSALEVARHTAIVSGNYRDWALAYGAKVRNLSNIEVAQNAATAAQSTELDDIDSALASLGM